LGDPVVDAQPGHQRTGALDEDPAVALLVTLVGGNGRFDDGQPLAERVGVQLVDARALLGILDDQVGVHDDPSPSRRATSSTPPPCRIVPPSTGKLWPVIHRARSESRNTTSSATSSGSPTRPSGIFAARPASSASSIGPVIFARTTPGDTALTRIVGA